MNREGTAMLTRRTATAALAAVLLLTASGAAAGRPAAPEARGKATPQCRANQVRVAAVTVDPEAGGYPNVLHISVTNESKKKCAVDRIPTVTFGELDGPALPEPFGQSGPYVLAPGKSGHAAVRTIEDLDDPETRLVDDITVAGAPAHPGALFTADDLDIDGRIRVWEPVTTWWQPTFAAAEDILENRVEV
ncbi:DUF4232 domain-containing protein [Streptomyces cavernicola]|uniref:DUF4232 domain-containing protein n=1 Tax=Streptomyces cavernicola TaxID=3043613 RepID=A0ABT6S6R1_9ACTN|nr:DUF4232 domain-containing protein [Streptomyces sp. B-S-A6]MDI3403769.1 DUF4232 domain-containing protein [Streptomyces sp. B-S-A6]